MKKNTKLKAEKVLKLKKIFKDLKTVIFFKNDCLNVKLIEKFKKQIKKEDAKLKVFKNRILKRVFENTKFSDLNEFLNGPLIIIYSNSSVLNLIKKIYNFKLNNKGSNVVAGFFDEQIMSNEKLRELSKLPNFTESLQNFIVLLKSPMSNLVATLEAIINKSK